MVTHRQKETDRKTIMWKLEERANNRHSIIGHTGYTVARDVRKDDGEFIVDLANRQTPAEVSRESLLDYVSELEVALLLAFDLIQGRTTKRLAVVGMLSKILEDHNVSRNEPV